MRSILPFLFLLSCQAPPVDLEPFPISQPVIEIKETSKELKLITNLLNQDFPSLVFSNYYSLFKDKDTYEPPTVNVGKYYFIAWALKHQLPFSMVKPIKTEVNPKQVLNGNTSSIGKKLCIAGKLIDISVRNIDNQYFSEGLIKDKKYTYKVTIIGGDNRYQVRDMVKMCGFVVGRYSYESMAGSTVRAIDLVGVWEIPSNNGAR